MCTYNRFELLKRAVKSVINQSFTDWELIIVDDGSNDGTKNNINSILSVNQNIIYHYLDHSGQAKAKNYGINKTFGEYITFLDSDDEYAYNHLEQIKNLVDKNNEVDFFHGDPIIIGSEFVPDKSNLNKQIELSDCAIGGTFVIKKSSISRLGNFPEIEYSEDSEYFNKLVENDINMLKYSFKSYIYHRDNPNSICNQIIE